MAKGLQRQQKVIRSKARTLWMSRGELEHHTTFSSHKPWFASGTISADYRWPDLSRWFGLSTLGLRRKSKRRVRVTITIEEV